MAQAKVSYTWGREAMAAVRRIAGRRARPDAVSPVPGRRPARATPTASCCPRFRPSRAANPARPTSSVQAYNFRIIATNDPANRMPWPKPRRLRPAALRTARAPARRHGEEAGPAAGVPRGDADRQHPQPQGRLQQQRRRSPPTTSARTTTTPKAATSAARRSGRSTSTTCRASTTSWPTTRACRSRCRTKCDEWGLCQGRVRGHRPLAAPALHARGAPHGGRVRDDAEGPADRAHQARRDRHGLLQQRLAQRAAHRERRTASSKTRATCRCRCSPTRFRTA